MITLPQMGIEQTLLPEVKSARMTTKSFSPAQYRSWLIRKNSRDDFQEKVLLDIPKLMREIQMRRSLLMT